MLNSMGLGFVFTARDMASTKMARLERRFTSLDQKVTGGAARMTASFKQLGLGLGVFVAGALAVAGGLGLANAAGKFEQGLAAVGAVTRATTGELNQLRESALEAGIQTQFSPDEAVDGLKSLATAGQTAVQATKTLVPVLDLAAGSLGQLGVAEAAEAVVGTLNAYGRSAEQAGGVTDKLLRITQLSNFQTRDFGIGLSKAAAAGAVFGQSLDDVLITMGLLRNRNIEASSSATAFRESVRRVGAHARAQEAVIGANVDIFDKYTGRMRSIVDIMSDFAIATADMTDEERNRRVNIAFGARGLLAFNAIQKASFTSMKDGTEVTLKGAEAIAAMREQMANTTGTASSFREKLLNTFAGQKTLLKGTLQTFAVVLGEPFAQVFKPIVKALVNGLNALLRLIKRIPKPIKVAVAGFLTVAGAIVAVTGAVILARAAFSLLKIGMNAVGFSAGGLVRKMRPVMIIVAAIAAASAALKFAYQRNLGGFGDFVDRLKAKTSLAWRSLKQLFSQGGFSGAVRKELARAENAGLKRFLIGLYRVAYRLQLVWEGIKRGFNSTIQTFQPVFEDFRESLEELTKEISKAFSDMFGRNGKLPTDEFLTFGKVIGKVLGGLVALITKFTALHVRLTSGIISGFRTMKKYLGPALETLKESFGGLADAWKELTGYEGDATDAMNGSTSALKSVGEVIGKVVGGIATFLTLVVAGIAKVLHAVVWVINKVKEAVIYIHDAVVSFTVDNIDTIVLWRNRLIAVIRPIREFLVRVGTWFMGLFGRISTVAVRLAGKVRTVFDAIRRAISNALGAMVKVVRGLLDKIPNSLLPENLVKLRTVSVATKAIGITSTKEGEDHTAMRAAAASSAVPAAVETGARSDDVERVNAALKEALKNKLLWGKREEHITLEVDGETLARASRKADEDSADRSFSPVPVY